nr:PREDICTED: uncharacterized protein LOC107398883 [Tribolium castaneum]|eukprot:XP_015839924.1 PREDICTED: uncharacterized protein LOC107398883 [Tribolium castaneum]
MMKTEECHSLGGVNPSKYSRCPYPLKELRESAFQQNERLANFSREDFSPRFKIGPKDRSTTTWVVEIDRKIRTVILRDWLAIGWQTCKVSDHIRITRCYKCQKFGHQSKDCQSEQTCGRCAGNYSFKECKVKEENSVCANCKSSKLPEEEQKHQTDSPKCPTYIRKIKDLIGKTDYGS